MSAKRLPVWVWFAIVNGAFLVVGAVVVSWLVLNYLSHRPAVDVVQKKQGAEANNRTPAGPPAQKPAGPVANPTVAAPAARETLSVADVIKKVDGGIVLLSCKNATGQEIGLGSGFVIDPAGLVATSFHVLRSASKVEAVCVDGTRIEVKGCRAWNEEGDLAILELASKPAGMEVLQLCRETSQPAAAEVIAIGHPQGFKFTTTTGIISAVHATSDLPQPYRDFVRAPAENVWIQTNAAISGGNSGGPLLNRGGEVVGINAWVARGQNLGFAVDVRHLRDLASKLQPEALPLAELTGPEEQLRGLVEGFSNQLQWLAQELSKAENETAAKELIDTRHPALDYLAKFIDFADKHRGKPAAFSALKTICEIASRPECPSGSSATVKQAADRILEDHRNDPRLVAIALQLGASPLEEATNLARRLSQESGNRKVQAASLLSLSMGLQAKQEDDPKRGDEAVAILERIAREFGDVEMEGAKLSEAVESMLFQAKFLAVGRQPPEIEGADQNGETFRLSDYKGKVVVLDFWADWCPHCVNMYPLERKLVTDYAKEPFALLGINCDEPARFKRVIAAKKVTWRNWGDGPGGPIAEGWRVSAYPTLYVLDHEGVIRYVNVRDEELVEAIKVLVAKAPKSGALASAPAASPPAASPPAASPPAASDPPDQPELRTWTGRDGRTAKFRFLGVAGENVKLRREDGREATVPLSKFSDDDQKWALSQPRP